MGIIIRQSIKSSIVSYAGVVIGSLNVLFLFNKFLTPTQLGLYAAITSFPLVFASLANLGIPHVAVRFFTHFKDDENQHHGFFAFLLSVPLVGCLIFSSLYLLAEDFFKALYINGSPLLVQYYYYLLPLTVLLVYMGILESYARVHLRIVVPAMVRELFLKLSNSVLALLFGFGYINFDQLVGGYILVYVFAIALLFIYIAWLGKLYWRFDFSLFRKPIFKEMLQYGGWVFLGGASAVLVPHIEKVILPAYNNGMQNTAIFDIALKIAFVMGIPRNVITQISMPLLAESWKNRNLKHVEEIYRKSALNLFIIGGFLFLGIWCNIDSIYHLIPKAEIYEQGKWVVLFVGLRQVIDMATGLNSEVILNSKYYRYDLFFYIFLTVLLFSTNLVLIPLYSFNGAAVALLVSSTVYNFVKYWFIRTKLKMQPFAIETLYVLGLLVLAYLPTLLVPDFEGSIMRVFLSIALKSSIICLIFVGGVIGFRLSEDASKVWELGWRKLRKMNRFG